MQLHLKLIKERKPIDIREIEDEYKTDNSVFSEDTERFKKLMNIINNKLSLQERNILLLYAETQRLSTVAEKLGVSTATLHKTITEIKNKVKKEL